MLLVLEQLLSLRGFNFLLVTAAANNKVEGDCSKLQINKYRENQEREEWDRKENLNMK